MNFFSIKTEENFIISSAFILTHCNVCFADELIFCFCIYKCKTDSILSVIFYLNSKISPEPASSQIISKNKLIT